jgi:hypothetical protein
MDEPLSSLDDERKRAIASDLLGLQCQFGEAFTACIADHVDLSANRHQYPRSRYEIAVWASASS